MKTQHSLLAPVEIFIRAAREYNLTIHSLTQRKPIDILFNKAFHEDTPLKLTIAQEKMIEYNNRNKKVKHIKPKEVVYQKDPTVRNKLQPRFKKRIEKI